jgi:hypothetical protein
LIIIKKKFENFKNSNNKIMIILFFFLSAFHLLSRPTTKVWFANGWNRTTKKEIEQRRRIWEGNTTHHFAHSHNKLSW